MSINPADLEKIDQQIKVQKGVLPMRYEIDNGDENPPNIDKSINGMSTSQKTSEGENGGVDVATALKGFWKFVDMAIGFGCSRIDAVDYTSLNDSELTNISNQTAQVEIFQKLAVAENAPLWLSIATVVGTFGTKIKKNPEWAEKQKHKKINEEITKRNLIKEQLSPSAQKVLEKAKESLKKFNAPIEQVKQEPVYDGNQQLNDISEPIEILDESERRIKEQLAAASEVTDADMRQMKIARRAAAIKRKFEEEEAQKRSKNSVVGYLDE